MRTGSFKKPLRVVWRKRLILHGQSRPDWVFRKQLIVECGTADGRATAEPHTCGVWEKTHGWVWYSWNFYH